MGNETPDMIDRILYKLKCDSCGREIKVISKYLDECKFGDQGHPIVSGISCDCGGTMIFNGKDKVLEVV